MAALRRFAFAAAARDAGFVALAAATLMLAFSFVPALSLSIGANVALVFAVCMILRAVCLRDESIERTEAWLILQPQERPDGDIGRRLARENPRMCFCGSRKPRPVRRSSSMELRLPFP